MKTPKEKAKELKTKLSKIMIEQGINEITVHTVTIADGHTIGLSYSYDNGERFYLGDIE